MTTPRIIACSFALSIALTLVWVALLPFPWSTVAAFITGTTIGTITGTYLSDRHGKDLW